MIGYYVHHVGRGHLHRARALAAELGARGQEVTGLSSLPRPADWAGAWLQLPRDDGEPIHDPTARGLLHWAPRGHLGMRSRMAALAGWIDQAAPDAMVVDVSMEVLLLSRLLGVPSVAVVLPGHRGDRAHLLGLETAEALVGFWPPEAADVLHGVPTEVRDRVQTLGALSRFPVAASTQVRPAREPGDRRGVVMVGAGGTDLRRADVRRLRAQTPGWTWTILDGGPQASRTDPCTALRDADVVITHAGESALAETAAARRPAVVIPQDRPHGEQHATAAVVGAGPWPAVVREGWAAPDWGRILDHTAPLDGRRWASWCDGRAAERFADALNPIVGRRR